MRFRSRFRRCAPVSNTTGMPICESMGRPTVPSSFALLFFPFSFLTYGLLSRIFFYSSNFSTITLSIRSSCKQESRYALSSGGKIFPGRGKAPLSGRPKLVRLQSSSVAELLAIDGHKQQQPSSLGPRVVFGLPLNLNSDHDLSHRRHGPVRWTKHLAI